MKKLITLAFVLLILGGVFAQNIKHISSLSPVREKVTVETKIFGTIEDNVFVTSTLNYNSINLKMSVYDKRTSVLIKTIVLLGFDNDMPDLNLRDAVFNKIIINNNLVYVVWEKFMDGGAQLILQIFDKDLQEIQSPKVIYQIENARRSYNNNCLFFYISNNGEKMVVGYEQKLPKSDMRLLNYNVLDKNQFVKYSVNTQIPFSLTKASSLYLDEDGFLYLIDSPNIYEKTGHSMKTKVSSLWNINPGNSKATEKAFVFENKLIQSLTFLMFNDYILALGTYTIGDERNNREQKDSVGVFTSKLNKYSYKSMGEVKFSAIGEENIVFTDYIMKKADSVKFSKKAFALNQMKKNDFFLSNCVITDDNGVLLVVNSQKVSASQSTSNKVSMYTHLIGINCIKIDKEGNINWVSSMEQGADFSNVSIPVISLLKRGSSFYSLIPINKTIINACMIDFNTGFGEKNALKKQFEIERVDFFNNDFYFIGIKRQNPYFSKDEVYFGRYELQ